MLHKGSKDGTQTLSHAPGSAESHLVVSQRRKVSRHEVALQNLLLSGDRSQGWRLLGGHEPPCPEPTQRRGQDLQRERHDPSLDFGAIQRVVTIH